MTNILQRNPQLRWLLYGSALLLQGVLYYSIFLPDYTEPHTERFIYISLVVSVLWVATLYLGNCFTSKKAARLYLILGLSAGILFRVICLVGASGETHLSTDAYRYIYDGKLTASGVNPFAFPPEHPLLAEHVDSTIYPNINHKELPTVYPPFSQFFFLISYLIDSDSLLGFNIVSALFELLALAALALLLRVNNLPLKYLLIYWLAPLVIIEFNLSAHQDMLYLPLLVLGIVTYQRKLPGWCGALLAGAVLTKFIVALIVPALLVGFTRMQRWRFVSIFLLSVTLLYVPYQFLLNPPELLGSLGAYLSGWQYNGSIYTLLERSLSLFTESSGSIAKMIVGFLLLGVTLFFSLRVKDKINAAALCLISYTALTPTLFPWYLLALLPFMLIRHTPALFALLALVSLSYWGMIGYLEIGLWYDNWYLRTLSYLPFYILLFPRLRLKLLEIRNSDRFAL